MTAKTYRPRRRRRAASDEVWTPIRPRIDPDVKAQIEQAADRLRTTTGDVLHRAVKMFAPHAERIRDRESRQPAAPVADLPKKVILPCTLSTTAIGALKKCAEILNTSQEDVMERAMKMFMPHVAAMAK